MYHTSTYTNKIQNHALKQRVLVNFGSKLNQLHIFSEFRLIQFRVFRHNLRGKWYRKFFKNNSHNIPLHEMWLITAQFLFYHSGSLRTKRLSLHIKVSLPQMVIMVSGKLRKNANYLSERIVISSDRHYWTSIKVLNRSSLRATRVLKPEWARGSSEVNKG